MTDGQKLNFNTNPQLIQSWRLRPLAIIGSVLLLAAAATAWNATAALSRKRAVLQNRLDEWSSVKDIARGITQLQSSLSAVETINDAVEYLQLIFEETGLTQQLQIEGTDSKLISAAGPRVIMLTCRFTAVSPDSLLPALLKMERHTSALRIREFHLTTTDSIPHSISGYFILQALTNQTE